jgi:hypothetical protein
MTPPIAMLNPETADEGDICYEWTAHNIEILGQFDPGAGYRWFGPIPEETK